MLQDLRVDRGKLELVREIWCLDDVFLRQLSVFHVLVVIGPVGLRWLFFGSGLRTGLQSAQQLERKVANHIGHRLHIWYPALDSVDCGTAGNLVRMGGQVQEHSHRLVS